MKIFATITTLAALLPVTFACNGYTGGVPKAVGTKTNKAVIEVAAGQVFDGQWYRYDRGSGACNSQSEGGKDLIFRYLKITYLQRRRLERRRVLPPRRRNSAQRDYRQEPG